jgi:hypothetical protein
MHGLFLFNRLQSGEIQNTFLAKTFTEWYGLESGLTKNSTCLLEPNLQRFLNDEEFCLFDFDFNFSVNPITVGQRLQIKNIIYHSKDYKRVGERRCNYVIRFKGEKNVNFGIIRYFFNMSGSIFVALNELNVKENITANIKGRTSIELTNLKRSGFLNRFFVKTELLNNLIFIAPTDIMSKCVVRQLSDNEFLISEFDIENDYN